MSKKPYSSGVRRGLFEKPVTLSFALEDAAARAIRELADERNIPFSQWLREAAREKLEREKIEAAAELGHVAP